MPDRAISNQRAKAVAARYALAVIAALAALLLREALRPWMGTNSPYLTIWASVVFAAWFCGVGPAIAATLIGLLGVWYRFLPPENTFRLLDAKSQITGMAVFAVLSGFVIALGEARRRAQLKQQAAEQSAHEKEHEFRLLAESIPELCWMARGDGHLFWYNQRWYEYTGTSLEQVEGWGWQSVHDPETLPSVMERWRGSLETGQPFEMEFPLRGADGIFRWFLTRIQPFRDEKGTVVRWFGLNTNIDDARKVRQSLIDVQEALEARVRERTIDLERRTAELLEKATLLDLANEAVVVRDADDKVSYWNQGAERLYGWLESEAIGRSTHELLQTKFPVPLEDIRNRDNWAGELQHSTRDGTQIVVASRWTALRDSSGKPVGWLELNTDITERKRAEQAARNLTRRLLSLQDDERRRIARDLHEGMGQSLAALKMNLDCLSNTKGREGAVVSVCTDILEKCLSQIRTISHLLHPPLLDEAGLRSAVQWYVEGFAESSGMKVNLELPHEIIRLGERVETTLFRVVQEALMNVHRHSGSSAVDIWIDVDAEHVELGVSDNGRGIPEHRLKNALEWGSGTGVGLAGIRERVRDLGGKLKIESNRSGTVLSATIPIAHTAKTASQSNLSPSAALPLASATKRPA